MKHQKRNDMLRTWVLVVLLAMQCLWAVATEYEFRSLTISNGLAGSHVNCIYKDKSGFVWMGTDAGLSRFDGFRFKNFYCSSTDKTSLLNNQVTDILEDAQGKLWVQTVGGYCIYDPATESFERQMPEWVVRKCGIKKSPDQIYIDSRHNFWMAVKEVGCFYYDISADKATLFRFGKGKNQIPYGEINCFAERGQSLVVTYNDGTLVRLDAFRHKVVWINRSLPKTNSIFQYYHTFIDHQYNYWVSNNSHTAIYSSRAHRWFFGTKEFLAHEGILAPVHDFLVRNIKEDSQGYLWIATEHDGLYKVNLRKHSLEHVVKEDRQPNTLPDNTLEYIYLEKSGAVWIGTYKNGVAYYSPSLSLYSTISLGDICTLVQDVDGSYWCGSNETGILHYNPLTGQRMTYGKSLTHLLSDVVVSSLRASDGSLWFGSFNGGLTHYNNGSFSAYESQKGGLVNNCVWALAEDHLGRIVIGTLGSGIQIFVPSTHRFISINTTNSALPSDYIASICVDRKGRIVIGHSQGVSFLDPKTCKVTNFVKTHDGESFASPMVSQVMEDSRGLLWNANMSGVDAYDPMADKMYHLYSSPKTACAITEDAHGTMWITLAHSMVRVKVNGKPGQRQFFMTDYDELDGLQQRSFNYRSIMCDKSGNIVAGGQDGISILPMSKAMKSVPHAKAIFCGIVLFDHPLRVGENYGGRVVLERSVNESHELRLKYSENAFSVLLASDHVVVPQKSRFLYRLKGFNDDHWLMTVESQPSITYTNLSPGKYTLQVKVVNRDGSVSSDISEMQIVIEPPVWLSAWAIVGYILLIAGLFWLLWYFLVYRKMEEMKVQQKLNEAERNHKMDEMKLSFLTDISHELRTPLALVISPVKSMLATETNAEKLNRLKLVYRNANRLLALVNQTLDLRKIESHKAVMNYGVDDIVRFVSEVCQSFENLGQKQITLTFHSDVEHLDMSFDADKMEKIVTNLLSNAFKFTPSGGSVSVSLQVIGGTVRTDGANDVPVQMLEMEVADSGCGISDADKQHVFDRFFQAHNHGNKPMGGSGIGLNLVKEFVLMHGGKVSVADNPTGGTIFRVQIPVTKSDALAPIPSQQPADAVNMPARTGKLGAEPQQLSELNAKLKQGEYEVLIVDDSEDFLSFVAEMLSSTYKVETATNGREALKKIAHHKPDIILSDVMMPEMDGNELCKAVRENPKTERIPFVMLTARLSTDAKIEGMANGADDYITKPFNFDLLNLRIYNLIKWRNATPVGEKVQPQIKQMEITSVDERLVQDATSFVEENLDNTSLSVEMMSDKLGMSRVNLYKRMLSVTGSTPSEFIRTIRLRHAAALLREGKFNVSEVAYKVGFNNPRYFSKYFAEEYGVMPSQYKKTNETNKD